MHKACHHNHVFCIILATVFPLIFDVSLQRLQRPNHLPLPAI